MSILFIKIFIAILSIILIFIPLLHFIPPIATLIFAFYDPSISMVILLSETAYLLLLLSGNKVVYENIKEVLDTANVAITESEEEMIKKYAIYIRYPLGAIQAGAAWTSMQLIGLVLTIIFVIKKLYIFVPLTIICSLLGLILRFRMDPGFFFKNAIEELTKRNAYISAYCMENNLKILKSVMSKYDKAKEILYSEYAQKESKQ